ncbi:MAG: lipocalin-like domain-containing protein [Candidatus Sericytochromatia bacterium]|nr:lipocalin-like domain-containing protein [Candidatus Sericytochromatia bacterium]
MNKRPWLSLATLGCLFAAAPVGAVAKSPAAFVPALPGYQYVFPRDHGAHPGFRTEWWYYTGHLEAPGVRRFGYQLTFFRVGLEPGNPLGARASAWRSDAIYLAHFALSDINQRRFHFADRLQRGGTGLANAAPQFLNVFLGPWRAGQTVPQGARSPHRHSLVAADPAFAIELEVDALKPPVIHGHEGISRKSDCPTCASHYYSLTRMATRGHVRVGTEHLPVTGTSWMDHEFGSNQLGKDEAGWDWFSLQLEDDSELMLYQLRRLDGTPVAQSSGTWVPAQGPARHLELSAFGIVPQGRWKSPTSGANYPSGWQVRVPGQGLELTVKPSFKAQELRTPGSSRETYWEGSVEVSGRRAGRPVKGRGYVELTGYARRFSAPI